MSSKRKDHKGKVLKAGESQRKDLRYQYRYTDAFGKRRTIYASTLDELRRKEYELGRAFELGLDYDSGQITVIELLERYISLKQGVRHSTKVGYQFVLNLVKKEAFGNRMISTIRVSDAKLWFMKLQRDGRGYSTITSVRGVIKPAFQMACDEDCIRKNPFVFKLTDAVVNDSEPRIALTDEQLKTWMNFIKYDKTYSKYYDEFVVLLETGMRVSEFCGLTKKDLDFKNRRIHVDHQLVRGKGGRYYIEKTKTDCGRRVLPMTDAVYDALQRMLEHRPKPTKEVMVDGLTNFIMLDKNGNPKVALHIENEMRWAMKKYRKLHPEYPLPHITPHVFRHTFCTNYANSGMDIKGLQYLMGHSDACITLNVYSHVNYEHAAEQVEKITKFRKTSYFEKDASEEEKLENCVATG